LEIDRLIEHAEKLKEESLYFQSLRLFKKAFQKYKKISHVDGMLHCMISLGDIYRMIGQFDLAIESYSGVIDLAKKYKKKIWVLDAKIGLGLSLRAKGKWKESLKLIRESKNSYIRHGDKEGIAFSLWAEAGALRIKGDVKGAIRTFKRSFHIFKMLKNRQGMGYCLCGIGGSSRIAGLFRDSYKYYTAANKLFSKIKDIFGLAYSYCGIGNAFRMLNDYKKAILYFSKATRLYKKIGDIVSYSYTLWGLGSTYKMMGNYKKAYDNFRKALVLFKKTDDQRGIIYCKLGIGELNLLQNKKKNAVSLVRDAFHESIKNGYAVEKCHAGLILSYLYENISFTKVVQIKEKKKLVPFSEKIDKRCYRKLGLKLKFQGLPFNMP
jgi:tetratricopeptide (TPR) repeat protein